MDKVKITGNDGRRAVFVKIYDVDIEEVGCAGTDASCGFYPNCANCNSQDGFSSGNYCSGNNVVMDYRDGYCAANVCVSSATPQVQQNCNSNQNCENAQCVLKSGCAYNNPSCSANYDCINNQCILRQGCNYNNPPCGSGQQCQNNVCVTPAPTCSNECSSGARECVSNNAYRICGNYNSDSCTEWSGSTSCGSGQVCSNGNCVNAMAGLNANLVVTSTQNLEGSNVQYNFDMTISESNGIAATIQPTYQRCFQSEGCQTATTSFTTIPANGQDTKSGWFNTPYHPNRVDYIYSWIDMNGNSGTVTASYNIP